MDVLKPREVPAHHDEVQLTLVELVVPGHGPAIRTEDAEPERLSRTRWQDGGSGYESVSGLGYSQPRWDCAVPAAVIGLVVTAAGTIGRLGGSHRADPGSMWVATMKVGRAPSARASSHKMPLFIAPLCPQGVPHASP